MTPKLRFPGFNDEWQVKKLGDIAKTVNGLTYSPKNTRNNGVLVLRSSNIQNSQLDFNDCVFVETDLKYNASKKGDILICVRNGSQALIGKNVYIDEDLPKTTHGAFMTVLRSEYNEFIAQLLQTSRYYSQVSADLGARINSINNSQLLKYKFHFPDKTEQEKIAGFLTAVDNRIALIDKKVELLRQYKKGVMQKIFTQQIRFQDESGKDYPVWQEKGYDEVLVSISTKPYQVQSNEYINAGKYPVVDQGQKVITGYSNDHHKVFNETPVIVFGDHTTILKFIDFDFIVGADGTKILKTKGRNDIRYLYHYLNCNQIRPEGYKRHFSILKQLKFAMPHDEEQQKIADFLTAIDGKIKAEEARLTAAKTFKKSLLQRMFV